MQLLKPDPDIDKALKWFLALIPSTDWTRRKEAIEAYLNTILEPKSRREDAKELQPVSITDDRMGWYLYLVETSLYSPYKCEPIQGSRVLPIFKRFGSDFELLAGITGAKERAYRLVTTDRSQPDSGIFELLTALLWARNGWQDVELLTEMPPAKRPDIRAANNQEEWFVECKRLAANSGYSQMERKKWLTMWHNLRDLLVDQRLPYILDIAFHVELETLSDNFLRDELGGKLRLISPPCKIISNATWDVAVNMVDLATARNHLGKYLVKNPSGQLYELIAGRRDPNKGFTCVIEGQTVRLGEGGGNNTYLDSLSFAAGAFWHCDAEPAIERKARDIRRRLSEAVTQLPENRQSVVHLGLETLDGWLVEAERWSRIANTICRFDAQKKDLRWIYCHLFQSYAPPTEDWVIDETVYHFSNVRIKSGEPLRHRSMVVPHEGEVINGVHWLRKNP